MEGTLPSKKAITLPSWDKVNEMKGYAITLDCVLPEILPCAYVHPLIDLTRVCTQDLST
jgi:hypothetical protein